MYYRAKKQGFELGHSHLIPMHIFKPRMLLVIVLVLCWDARKGFQANANHQKNVRLRAPSSFLSQQQGPRQESQQGVIGSILPDQFSDETAVTSFVGNIAEDTTAPKQKKDCSGMPSIAARGLVGPTLKRSYFAATKEELDEKLQEESNRKKREVKRNEVNEASLPWTCETKYDWLDMGSNHYPRFVRTAECKSRTCFNGFFRCRPRRYKTKILKRVSPSDSTSCEEDDVSLPESLRPSWRFITVTISLCCDCVGRIPTEV